MEKEWRTIRAVILKNETLSRRDVFSSTPVPYRVTQTCLDPGNVFVYVHTAQSGKIR